MREIKGLVFLLTFFLVTVPLWGQDTGVITGRVEDPSGAVIAGAEVQLLNVATNIEDRSRTNNEGVYRIPGLRPATYRLTVSAAGFKRFARQVDLRVGETLLMNATLEIGTPTETVEVTAATPLLQTETTSTGTIVQGNYFYRMPFFQGHTIAALYLTPGVLISGAGYSGGTGGFQINGESASRKAYFEDGVYGLVPGTGISTQTISSTVDEIKVLTTVLPAEYGHSAGGAIVVAKKTGTNSLHGAAVDYGSYGGMMHRYFFQKYKRSQPRPEEGLPNGEAYILQQPQANLTGPIYLPKIYDGRNRSFFMFGIKRYIQKEGMGQVSDVPTVGELNGDFSYPERPSGVTIYPIYDPRTTAVNNGVWTRQPFAGNLIPKSDWSPVAKNFLAMNPWTLPNVPGDWTTTGPTNNFMGNPQRRTFYENYSARLDHQLSAGLKVFATWTYNSKVQTTPNLTITERSLNSSYNKSQTYQHTGGVGGTYVFGPTLISETRMNYYRYDNPVTSVAYGKDWGALLGIPNIGKLSLPGGLPISVGNPSVNVRENFNFRQDVSKLSGKHAFKFGYDLLRFRVNSYSLDNDAGTFSIIGTQGLNSNGSNMSGTGGTSLTGFLVGAASSYSVSVNLLSNQPRDWIHSLYIQDDWKATPAVTVNLGLRWQVESPPNNKYGQQSTFDPTAPDNTMIGAKGVILHPAGSMYNKDWNNFQPRIGLAWNLRKRIVLRTGWSVNTVDHGAQNPPTEEFGSITATWNRPSGEYRPLFLIHQGPDWTKFSWPAVRADGSIPMSGVNYGNRGATWVNPDRPEAYTMNWNFGLQLGLAVNYLLELTYNGNRSLKSWESWQVNTLPYDYAWNMYQTNPTQFNSMVGNPQNYRPWTNFGGVTFQGFGANAVYHSGTVKIEKRYSYGLTAMAFYTYGKSISESSSNTYISRKMDRARSSFDRTHMFTGSMNYEVPVGKGRRLLNRGGILNALFGGYDVVWVYQISSGNPLTFGLGGTLPQYMPSIVATRSGRPNSTGERARLRDNWTDLGGDRFTQSNQNKLIESMSYFTIPAAYTMGNVGAYTMDAQRFIAANFSASKQFKLRERLVLEVRYDFQNPFKWYNWPTPNTSVNFTNPGLFGTVSTNYTNEPGTASNGGVPMQNINIELRF